MTRGKVVKMRRREVIDGTGEPFAYVLHDEDNIVGLVCAKCYEESDDGVPIFTAGTIVCDRCGETA
jgi:hypothetical protein